MLSSPQSSSHPPNLRPTPPSRILQATSGTYVSFRAVPDLPETDIQEKEQKESQKQQIQARNGKGKVKTMLAIPLHSQKAFRWLRLSPKKLKRNQRLGFALDSPHTTSTLVFALSKEAQAASPRDEDFGYK
ncbi:hypothetical protein Tco_0726771 [Tanacetum coccineum]|uniref:Uncharacterized protein n=1 Tax=Tanacetum coccineum TaxID=301880 RepID=A0ABQ4YH47_9ASTR